MYGIRSASSMAKITYEIILVNIGITVIYLTQLLKSSQNINSSNSC